MFSKKITVIFFLCFFCRLEGTISEDRFWRVLFRDYGMGYTLFGDKPMTFDRYYVVPEYNFWRERGESPVEFWKELPFVSNGHFCLKKVRFQKNNIEYEESFLINKTATERVICRHLNEFKQAFPQYTHAQEILDLICENGPHCLSSHRLLGLLLGFGDHNTRLFQQRDALENELIKQAPFQNSLEFSELSPEEKARYLYGNQQALVRSKASWFRILQKVRAINHCLKPFDTQIAYRNLLPIPLPCFVADPDHEETKHLLRHYLKLNKHLALIYYAPDFLDRIKCTLLQVQQN